MFYSALLAASFSFAQDVILPFSNQNLVALNPSFAGSNGLVRAQSYYYNQFPELVKNNLSFNNAVDAYIKPLHGAIAVNYFNHPFGGTNFQSQQFSVAYAQHISLRNNSIKIVPSLQYSYGESRTDIIDFGTNFNQGILPVYFRNKGFQAYHSLGTGILFNYKKLYVGAVLSDINHPVKDLQNNNQAPTAIRTHASYSKTLGAKTLVQVMGIYVKQNDYQVLQINTNLVLFNHLIAGAGVRSSDAILTNVGYRHTYFSALLGYDYNYSMLAGNNTGSWSAALSFNLRNAESRHTLTSFESW